MKKIVILNCLILSLCACVCAVGCAPPANHEHEYTTLVERIESTCSAKGKEVYKCACEETKTITLEIDSTKHDYKTQYSFNAQKHWKECRLCSDKLNEFAHEFLDSSKQLTKAPTCNEKGLYTYTCVCGQTHTEDIPADPTLHDFKGEYFIDGNTHYQKCQECQTAGTKTAHEFLDSSKEQTKAPTCDEKGLYTYTCVCGQIHTEDIPADPTLHDFKGEYFIDGNTHYQKCQECQTAGTKTAHEFTKEEKNQSKHWVECEDCGAKSNEENHEFTWQSNISEHAGVCDCGQEIDGAHSFAQGEFTCSVCETAVYTVTLKAKASANAPDFYLSNKVVQDLGLTDLGNGVYQIKVLLGEKIVLPVMKEIKDVADEYYAKSWVYGNKTYTEITVNQTDLPTLITNGTIELTLTYGAMWTPFF